jgi:aspartate aminotransferase/aminotransferase
MADPWIADRMRAIEISGIRKVFELARSLKDPVNLSIGQPHFDVPESIKAAAKAAIDAGHNGYTVTQGIAPFRDRIQRDVAERFPGQSRDVMVTTGTSGGLLLALLTTVNPGEEVLTFDPYFVCYPHMVTLTGGRMVTIDTYPDFRVDPDRVKAAITPKTKVLLFSSPSNPTGVTVPADTLRELVRIARERNILVVSDEIYRAFAYDEPHASVGAFDENVLVIEGFGKTYGMTGWRLGYAHGPRRLIEEMTKLQQFTYVCAPSMVQHAGVAAMDFDVSGIVADYKRKRDLLLSGLSGRFEVTKPGGAFYLFPKAPRGTGSEFVAEAIRNNLLVIPGGTFSRRDSHFRISYAASDETLHRGVEILNRLAAGGV